MARAKEILDGLSSLVRGKEEIELDTYRIGDLAGKFALSLRTLRFYEDRGLLSPERAGSTRLYDQDEHKRLKVILFCKLVGLPLSDIEEVLKIYDSDMDEESVKGFMMAKLREQLTNLENQKREIDISITELGNAMEMLRQPDQTTRQ